MTSVLALGCLCFVSSTAICFFTLLFAVQNPLLLLLIGLKQNSVLLETYGHLGGGGRKWNKLDCSWEMEVQNQESSPAQV